MTEPTIIYENDDVLVINKPTGLLVHSDTSDATDTGVAWFLEHAASAHGVGEPRIGSDGSTIERSGIVHRLDKDTSGVLILAKRQAGFDHLKQQFKDRRVKKTYRALVYGHMHERWGTIDRQIGRSAKDFRLRSAQRGAKGTLRDAVTNWECIGKGEYEGEPYSYVKLLPTTGRMHQLRVHMKAIDRPIVADPLYAGKKLEQSNNLGIKRLALHAHELALTLPNGTEERFVAPLPQDFIEAADRIVE